MQLELAYTPTVRHRTIPATVASPRLSVLIVNYCQWEQTWQLVQQLRASPLVASGHVEIVVVDNHSPAHPLLRRLRRLEGVSVRRWERNRGFARAVNEGWRLSRGDWLLLLNPDVTVAPGFVEALWSRTQQMESEPTTGIVGFGLRDSDGSRQGSTGPFPTLWRTLTGLLTPRSRRKYHAQPEDARCRVPWVTGCCLLARQDCLADVGGLDRDFFLYYEDVDLCQRAQAHGWQVVYDPSLEVTHHTPLHSRPLTPLLRLVTRHALLQYARKHWPAWQHRLLAAGITGEALTRQLLERLRGTAASTDLLAELLTLATAMTQGDHRAAARCLQRVVRSSDAVRQSTSVRPTTQLACPKEALRA